MSKRFQILKNSVPIAVVSEDEVEGYYKKYDADKVVELEEDIPDIPEKMEGITYVLVYRDIGETCDGHVRKMSQYSDLSLAEDMLKSDMKYQLEQHPDWVATYREVHNEDYTAGCIYDIIEVEY